jgi:hypothetical protein
LREVDFKTKSGKDLRNFGTYVTYLEFPGGFNGAKTRFVSPTVREIFEKEKRQKSGNQKFAALHYIVYLGPQAE